MTDAKGVATPGTDDVGGPKASKISELRRTAKWRDPPEEMEEEDDPLTGEKTAVVPERGGEVQFPGRTSCIQFKN